MDNEVSQVQMDGSIDSAVAHMPDIESMEQGLPDRGDDGKFKSREPIDHGEPSQAPEPEEEVAAQAEDEADPSPEPASDDDEETFVEYFESEEEGAEPVQLKLQDAVDGYRRAKELEQEIENIRAVQPAPVEYDQAIDEYVQKLGATEQAIQQWLHISQVQAPDERLITEDPELYAAQLHQARAVNQQRQHALAQLEQVQQAKSEEELRLEASRWQREQAKIYEMWPELRQQAAILQVAQDLESLYGLDAQTLNGIRDARAFQLMKDALAYRKTQAASKKAVKAVAAKPKLVKAKAPASNQQRRSQAIQRAAKSGSMEDAAEAIGQLI